MKEEYEKSGCATCFGRFNTMLHIFQLLIDLVIVVRSIGNEINILFPFMVWVLLALQILINFAIAFAMFCGYSLKYEHWQTLKKYLLMMIFVQGILRTVVPMILALVMAFTHETERKSYYETMLYIFGTVYGLDLLGLLCMCFPFFCLYKRKSSQSYLPVAIKY